MSRGGREGERLLERIHYGGVRRCAVRANDEGIAKERRRYILLGLVGEKATGTTIERQLRTRILKPLGLTQTSLPNLPTLPPPVAHGYLLPGNTIIPVGPKRRLDVTLQSPSGSAA